MALAFLLPSCLQHETTITLNEDGSGTITEEVVLNAQMAGMLEMAQAQGEAGKNPLVEMKDETKAKKRAQTFGEGVSFVKTEDIKTNDGGKGVRVTYKFTDINKVSLNPDEGMGDPRFISIEGGGEVELNVDEPRTTFKFADGKLTILSPQPEDGEDEKGAEKDGNEEAGALDPEDPQAAMALQMMKGLKMGARIKIPAGIAESNATYQDGNTITLFEMDLDEAIKNPGGIGALKKLEGMEDPDLLRKTLKDLKGVKFETKEKVTATLK